MKTFFTALFCIFSFISFGQSYRDLPPNAEPGKCYAKCMIEDIWITEEYEIPVYIGKPDDETVKRKKKTIGGETYEVVKKPRKVDPKYFEWKLITKRILEKKGGFTDWREILCAEKVTSYTIQKIQEALASEGFLTISSGEEKNRFGSKTKEALINFQKENDLPVGNLDLKTLDALGIHY